MPVTCNMEWRSWNLQVDSLQHWNSFFPIMFPSFCFPWQWNESAKLFFKCSTIWFRMVKEKQHSKQSFHKELMTRENEKEKHYSKQSFCKVLMACGNQKVWFRYATDSNYALVMTTLSKLIWQLLKKSSIWQDLINSSSIIHGVMNNVDHEENTLSGIGRTMIAGIKDTTEKISRKSINICGMSPNKRSLE